MRLFHGGIQVLDPGGSVVIGNSKALRFLGSVLLAQVGNETQITVGGGALVTVQDEGANIGNLGILNFVGAGVNVVENPAGVAEITISGVANIDIEDEGAPVGGGSFQTLNFVGGGVTVIENPAGTAEITIPQTVYQDEGANVGGGTGQFGMINFVGTGVTVSENPVGVVEVNIPVASQLLFQDEGINVATLGTVNFVGGGVTVIENPAGTAEITIPQTVYQDEGANVGGGTGQFGMINFVGAGVTVSENPVGVVEVNIPVTGQLLFQDEGINVGTFGTINFVGANVVIAENPAGVAEVSITPGSPTGNTNRAAFFNNAGDLDDNALFQFFAATSTFVIGFHTLNTNPSSSLIFGSTNTINVGSQFCIVNGFGNTISHQSAALFGEDLVSTRDKSLNCGLFNDTGYVTNALFGVGFGVGLGAERTGLAVDDDGITKMFKRVDEPRTQALGAGFTIGTSSILQSTFLEINGAGVTSSGVTAIENGTYEGQRLTLLNTNVGTITLQNGANVRLPGAANLVLGQFDVAEFIWSGTLGEWICTSSSNN